MTVLPQIDLLGQCKRSGQDARIQKGIRLSLPKKDDLIEQLPPVVENIKRKSDCHFFEGYFGSPNRVDRYDQARIEARSPRRSPLVFFSDKEKYVSPRAKLYQKDSKVSPRQRVRSKRSESVVSARSSSTTTRVNSVNAEKLMNRQREACESLRILVFGAVGNEKWKAVDKNRIFEQQRGTPEEIQKFVEVWSHLDEDGSGDIDFGEFLDYFSRTNVDRLLCMRCVKFLLLKDGKVPAAIDEVMRGESSTLSRKITMAKCCREDMMKLLWLKANDEDIRVMSMMFDLYNVERVQVCTPPPLPKKKRKQLLENFNYLDKERVGFISYSEMVEAELVDEHLKNDLQAKYDCSGRGILDADDFLEMLCPFGFQAHDRVTKIVTADDTAIYKIHVDCRHLPCGNDEFVGWIPEAELRRLQEDGNVLLESLIHPESLNFLK